MQGLGPRDLKKNVLKQDLCIGCGACLELCPYLRLHHGRAVMLFDCDLETGRCSAFCPRTDEMQDQDRLNRPPAESTASHPFGTHREILAARAGSAMSGGDFQNGGTVSSLIAFALDNQLIDRALLTDREGLRPLPRNVSTPEEVLACSGSKYMLAPTLSGLNRSIRQGLLRNGVVGTPCQAKAVARIRNNPLQQPDFQDPVTVSIGLFCTWGLDPHRLERFLSEHLCGETLLKMDIPPPPAAVLRIETETRQLEILLERIRHLIPPGCLVCPDMTAEFADISVGVLEEDPAWNLVIVRTAAGADLLAGAKKSDWIETRPVPTASLERLSRAAAGKKQKETPP